MTRPAWRTVAWMCAAHVASMSGFATFATLLPRLQQAWGITNTGAGFVSGALLAGYMVAVPLLTTLTDRVDARRVYFGACLLTAAGALGFAALARGTLSGAAFQMLAGAGVAGTYMPGLKALTDNVEGPAQSRAVSFYTACFGFGLSLSALLAGAAADALGWRGAFALAALGPLVAGTMVLAGLPARRPAAAVPMASGLAEVARDPRPRAFMLGYAVHCWELFGSRSWLVAFLTFAQGAAAWPLGPVAIVAAANAASPFASIAGNEVALRAGRPRVIRTALAVSGVFTCLFGLFAGLPGWALAILAVLHLVLVNADSAALTAGLVGAAPPGRRGAALALHSTLGFGAGFLAPLAFGAALDLAGGNARPLAWQLAFVTLGAGGVVAAFALRLRTRHP
ncbi:MAG: MFS transporter [Burkholderiales bacterium]|nr:MFS transporter [Burkholderiales bacterium]